MSSTLLVVTTDLVSKPESINSLKKELIAEGVADLHQQLLERVEAAAVALPVAKFQRVFFAAAPGDTVSLSGRVSEALWTAMAPGGFLDGAVNWEAAKSNLLIAGFVPGEKGWQKIATFAPPTALKKSKGLKRGMLKFERQATTPPSEPEPETDDDLLDEDELVDGIAPAIQFPAKCDPGPGKKRRRACKDCTCGLKEMEDAEDSEQRERTKVVLGDLAEIDFTVPGKAVGGCGSCALGDAFRCDGCPYLGLPPFKPGEVVTLDGFGDDI